jgi:hypothetical protein
VTCRKASIFAHPLPHQLDARAVEDVLAELGAEISQPEHGMTKATLLGQHGSCHFNLHAVAAGVGPGAYPV